MRVLAFETSCDETSAAVVAEGFHILSNVTRTHVEHARFGGVVPEIASRAHMRLIWPVTQLALQEAGVRLEEVDALAVTRGPGLVGALLVGVMFGKTLAQVLGKPILGINHLEGHIFSVFPENPDLTPPLLVLIVSGGHTELVWMEEFFRYRYLGWTLDDAAGEAFDKVAKLLGLPYPGGPVIDRLAREGDPEFAHFPRARVPGLDFSFSGIKTAVLYYLRDHDPAFVQQHLKDIAASFQEAVVDMLLEKLLAAWEETKARTVAVVGGVSLNSRLRQRVREALDGKARVLLPPPALCVDNAGMIGAAALKRFERGFRDDLDFGADPNLALA